MPNGLALLMLAAWPVITLVIFRRLALAPALIWSLLLAYLILPPLPAAFDFPLLPPFSKQTIPQLSILLVLLVSWQGGRMVLPRLSPALLLSPLMLLNPGTFVQLGRKAIAMVQLPRGFVGRALVLGFVFSPVATVLNNGEPLVFQRLLLPGLGLTDGLALVITQGIILLGFLLARRFLAGEAALRALLMALMLSGLGYSLLMLIEIRLSPQLNIWIYGYFQADFDQMMRGGGFRPLVFLNHGLWAAFFLMSAVIAAAALWRIERPWKYLLAAGYLAAVLILSKSLGALVFAMILLPLVVVVGFKNQIRLAAVLAVLALSYPVLKSADLVPVDKMLQQAESVSAERAGSLKFRFDNEDMLYQRLLKKPLFGWGSWGRPQLHDPVSGKITSVSDGRWIVVIGTFGWIGFIAEFGLLALPLLVIWRETRGVNIRQISPYLGPLCLLLAINMVDLLPNATLTPLTWLLAGALLGYGERLREKRLSSQGFDLSSSAISPPRTVI